MSLSKLRRLGLRVFSQTPLEYPARLTFTCIFQFRAFQIDMRTRALIKAKCHPGSICVDVGAYRGDILRAFLRHTHNGKVIAFEPDPENFSFIKRRFPSVEVVQTALGDTEEPRLFFRFNDYPARNHLATQNLGDLVLGQPDEKISVPATTLDSFFGRSGKIDFIKIDAEGAELEILKGGINVLRRSKPLLIIEHGYRAEDFGQETSRELFELLASEIDLDIFPLHNLETPIRDVKDFLDLISDGTDYFFAEKH